MKTHFKILIPIISLLFATHKITAQEATKVHKDSLEIVVEKYYELNLKTFQENSTIEDIDNIFELFTGDFTYIHPKYGGTYAREDLYNGYVRNQKNGRYDGNIINIKVSKKITGLNAVVVQRIYVKKKGDGIEEGEPKMTLFEFKKRKIYRIFEYW